MKSRRRRVSIQSFLTHDSEDNDPPIFVSSLQQDFFADDRDRDNFFVDERFFRNGSQTTRAQIGSAWV
jgi:hypothetical protein